MSNPKQASVWHTADPAVFIIAHDDVVQLQKQGVQVFTRDPKSPANPLKINNLLVPKQA